jgi:hypothetical protein
MKNPLINMLKHLSHKLAIAFLLLASAQAPAKAGSVGDIFNSINKEINKVNQFFDGLVKEVEGLKNGVGSIVSKARGQLGLPDLKEVETSVEAELTKTGELAQLDATQTYIEAETIKTHADSILGAEGQENAKNVQVAVNDAAQAVAALEIQASKRGITQEVMKDIAAQQTQLAAQNSALNESLLGLKQTTAYNNRAIAKQIQQQQKVEAQKTQERQEINNTELGAISVLKSNLFAKTHCTNGQKTVFVDKNGNPATVAKDAIKKCI